MERLKGTERKFLRGLAHGLKPLVQVGKSGLTGVVISAVDAALADHELVKVKFLEFKKDKKELSGLIGAKTDSELVGLIGNVAIFYREQADPAKRKIKRP